MEGLEAALDADPSLLYALNRGGASLVDVASERQRVAVVTLLRARENPARRRLVELIDAKKTALKELRCVSVTRVRTKAPASVGACVAS